MHRTAMLDARLLICVALALFGLTDGVCDVDMYQFVAQNLLVDSVPDLGWQSQEG